MLSVIISSGCQKDPHNTRRSRRSIMFPENTFTLSVPETAKYLKDIRRNSIGLDEWFRRLESSYETQTNFPPYNLVKESDTKFKLELALAGYSKNDIEVITERNKLQVESKKVDENEQEYVHRGLAKRAFSRSWTLSDDVIVGDVTLKDGLLTIGLDRVVPEHQKRKVYEIA